jgi:hypothetical protein
MGLLAKLWEILIAGYGELRGTRWQSQSLDIAMVEGLSRAATGPDAADRAESGMKRHVLPNQRSAPLAATVTLANVHDLQACSSTLDHIVVARREPHHYHPQHLCLDKR